MPPRGKGSNCQTWKNRPKPHPTRGAKGLDCPSRCKFCENRQRSDYSRSGTEDPLKGQGASCRPSLKPVDWLFRPEICGAGAWSFSSQFAVNQLRSPTGSPYTMKTYMAKAGEVDRQWWLFDAEDQVVGRLAVKIATLLMGKHRPTYTPHVDTGDYVVVVNAEKVAFTGNKWDQKQYTRYTGWPGLRTETAADRRERHPERILQEAVRRMLPKNKLGRKMLEKLKVYVGEGHPHQAQDPKPHTE